MQLAIDEAWRFQGLTFPNPAVGAVITRGGSLISLGAHKKAGEPHAEVLAIQKAFLSLSNDTAKKEKLSTLQTSNEIHEFLYENHDGIFRNAQIYTTLEPCNHYGKTPPCALLISKLGFEKIIYGSSDFGDGSKGGGSWLEAQNLLVEKAFMIDECDALLEPFLMWNKSQFIFFKYAQTLNGMVAPGKISCDYSFALTHAIRDKIDLLIIGGNTVRTDRPTLDARLVGGKAPDVMILSRRNDFDFTIPLFGVPNRTVFIVDKLEIPKKYRFAMIEGGSNMFELVRDIATHFLIFIAPKMINGVSLSIKSIDLDYLNIFRSGGDIAIWAKRRKR
jgi:diaminohydroxyphosphoribosylaminopyrimidine deaminase / 5-amino-6-(5-phosphoribosylamino)uracil reductase